MPTIDMIATGRRIHDYRVARGMTIRDIQTVCGVSEAAVMKWQTGKTIPSIDNMVILASVWNVEIDDIVAATGK